MLETTLASSAPDVKITRQCRMCGDNDLEIVLDLGTHAVSDFYAEIPKDELRAPLALVQCNSCNLVQLSHSVSRDRLYRDYWYRSGLNPSMAAALRDVVQDALQWVKVEKNDFVLDIGANDGTLLDQYPPHLRTIAIEPSNLSLKISPRHVSYHDYYPGKALMETGQQFKIITSIAMFYDLDDPHEFLKRLSYDLHPEGIWVNQMMDLEGMLAANAFDNICHEHVVYWHENIFMALLRQYGLGASLGELNSINGGSIRHHIGTRLPQLNDVSRNSRYAIRAFKSRIELLRNQCVHFLEKCQEEKKLVLGYGASTKGNTLLQYYGIASDLLPAIAERNPDKVGKLTAGSHIPIISEEEMRARKPDYLLIFPWHFLDGFLEREKELRDGGTKFIVPLPQMRVL